MKNTRNTRVPRLPQRLILSPEGSCESRTEGGPIVFTYVLSPEGRYVVSH